MLYLAQDGGADPHDFAAAHGFLDRCRSRPASSCVWRFQTDLNGRSQGCNLLPCLLAMEPYGTGRRSWTFLCRVKAGLAAAAPARYLVCKVRLELTRPRGHRVLNLTRLPFRHMHILVGRVGFEPTVFLMSRLYSPLASASLHTYPYWLQGRDSDPHITVYEAVVLPFDYPAILCPKVGAGVEERV